MKQSLLIIVSLFFSLASQAQSGEGAFKFLELPFSSHAAALGGDNITIIEDNITLAIHNPALLSSVTSNTLNLNYMNYISGVNMGSAAFARTLGERSTWAVAAQYVNYGNFKETNAEDTELGEFTAKDMALSGIYSYNLTEYLSGGITGKMIYSKYERYSSFAIGVDLGLNYYNSESELSASIVARNLGGQIKAFDEIHEKLPFDLLIGISKRLSHAPFRLSATMHDLTNWNRSSSSNIGNTKESVGKVFMNHFIFGLDFLPTESTYLSIGYNCKRASDMKVNGASNWSGMALGGGLQIKKIKVGLSYAKYHPSSSSLLLNFAMTL